MNCTFKTWRNFNSNLGVLYTAESIIVPEINVAVFGFGFEIHLLLIDSWGPGAPLRINILHSLM